MGNMMDFSLISFAVGGGLSALLIFFPRIAINHFRGGKQLKKNQQYAKEIEKDKERYRSLLESAKNRYEYTQNELAKIEGTFSSQNSEIEIYDDNNAEILEKTLDYTKYIQVIADNPFDKDIGEKASEDYKQQVNCQAIYWHRKAQELNSKLIKARRFSNYETKINKLDNDFSQLKNRSNDLLARYNASYVSIIPALVYQTEKAIDKFKKDWGERSYAHFLESTIAYRSENTDPFVNVDKHLKRLQKRIDTLEDFRSSAIVVTDTIRKVMRNHNEVLSRVWKKSDMNRVLEILKLVDSMEYREGDPILEFRNNVYPVLSTILNTAAKLKEEKNVHSRSISSIAREIGAVQSEIQKMVANKI